MLVTHLNKVSCAFFNAPRRVWCVSACQQNQVRNPTSLGAGCAHRAVHVLWAGADEMLNKTFITPEPVCAWDSWRSICLSRQLPSPLTLPPRMLAAPTGGYSELASVLYMCVKGISNKPRSCTKILHIVNISRRVFCQHWTLKGTMIPDTFSIFFSSLF